MLLQYLETRCSVAYAVYMCSLAMAILAELGKVIEEEK